MAHVAAGLAHVLLADLPLSLLLALSPPPLLPPPTLSILLGGVALFSVGGDISLSLQDAVWLSWTYVADAGNHADSTGWGRRCVAVCVSIGGMLIFALMVGLVTESISEKVDSLKKGRSDVIERNHTLILGWSDKLVRQCNCERGREELKATR